MQTITNSHAPHAIFKQKSELRLLKPGKCTLCELLGSLQNYLWCLAVVQVIVNVQVTQDFTQPTSAVRAC